MWAKLKWLLRWLWPAIMDCPVRVSGTFTTYRHYRLPTRFQVLVQFHSSTGRSVFICNPFPDFSGQLFWYAPSRVEVYGENYTLLRSPSIVPSHLLAEAPTENSVNLPNNYQEHLRFTT